MGARQRVLVCVALAKKVWWLFRMLFVYNNLVCGVVCKGEVGLLVVQARGRWLFEEVCMSCWGKRSILFFSPLLLFSLYFSFWLIFFLSIVYIGVRRSIFSLYWVYNSKAFWIFYLFLSFNKLSPEFFFSFDYLLFISLLSYLFITIK